MKQIREASGLSSNARLSTKAIVNNDDIDKKEDVNTVSNENNNGHKPGSIAARANMVKNYNENK